MIKRPGFVRVSVSLPRFVIPKLTVANVPVLAAKRPGGMRPVLAVYLLSRRADDLRHTVRVASRRHLADGRPVMSTHPLLAHPKTP